MSHLIFGAAAIPAMIALLLYTGYPVARIVTKESTFQRLIWSTVVGLAMIIIVTQSLNMVLPVRTAKYLVFALLAGYAWMWRGSAWQALRDDLSGLNRYQVLLLLLPAITIAILLNIPFLLNPGLVTFDGSTNYDPFHYVINARWMLDHGFYEQVVYSLEQPLFSVSKLSFGFGANLGRTGAESFLALISSTVGLDPVYLYHVVITLGAILATWSPLLFVDHEKFTGRTALTVLAILLLTFNPILIYTVMNANFSSLFGAVFLAAVLAALYPGNQKILLGAIMLSALATTYPEVLPLAVAGVGVAALIAAAQRHDIYMGMWDESRQAIRAGLISLAVVPWFWVNAYFVVKFVYFVSRTQGSNWGDPFAGLNGPRILLAGFTAAPPLAQFLGGRTTWVLGAALVLAILVGVWAGRKNLAVLGAGGCFLLLGAFVFLNGFNYGKLKVFQYFLVFLPVLYLLALTESARLFTPPTGGSTSTGGEAALPGWLTRVLGQGRPVAQLVSGYYLALRKDPLTHGLPLLLRGAGFSAVLLMLIVISSGSSYHVRRGVDLSRSKSVHWQFIETAEFLNSVRGNEFVAHECPNVIYYTDMWFAYFAGHHVTFPPGSSYGGYVGSFFLSTKAEELKDIDAKYILGCDGGPSGISQANLYLGQGSDARVVRDQGSDAVLFQQGPFRAISAEKRPTTDISFETLGLWPSEGDFRWMSDKLSVEYTTSEPVYLNVRIHGGFGRAAKEELIVQVGETEARAPVNDFQAQFSVLLPSAKDGLMVIEPALPTRTPKELTGSTDARKLSFQVREFGLTGWNKYPVVGK